MGKLLDFISHRMARREAALRDAIAEREARRADPALRFESAHPGYRIGATRCHVDGTPLLIVRTPDGDTLDLSDVVAHIESQRR